MSDEQIDNLLMGLSVNSVRTDNKKSQVCANCRSPNLILDVSKIPKRRTNIWKKAACKTHIRVKNLQSPG
jgi:hypothetical protein